MQMMFNKNVVAYTPYGRERTVRILLPYMVREHASGVLDEWMLCMNTDKGQFSDREYARGLAERFDWINIYECPGPDSSPDMKIPSEWRESYSRPKQLNTGRFFFYMQDRETVYLRFDDDIVWVHPDAMSNMVSEYVNGRGFCAVFPVIWNNAMCSHWLQQIGHPVIPKNREVGMSATDKVGWGDPRFAIDLHGGLLETIESGEQDSLLVGDHWDVPLGSQFSVSCYGIGGETFASTRGVIPKVNHSFEEESWLTKFHTAKFKSPLRVIGNAHVSHFSFFTQREFLLKRTNFLERYENLAEDLWVELGDV
jgi:hypothetical protein